MRELTKIHEQLVKLPSSETQSGGESRGEFTVIVGPESSGTAGPLSDVDVADIFGRLTDQAGLSSEMTLMIMDKAFHLSPAAVRKAVKRRSISVKRQNDTPA
jgi:16S rRNA C1402 (ribose-2'-O) methylase RsmI